MPEIVVVNASDVLTDAEVGSVVPALQEWDDKMLAPAWGLDRCIYSFTPRGQFDGSWDWTDPRWPLLINRHSLDPGALGWHDDRSGRIFGRVFAGDCIRYGVSWTVDLSHEAAEMRVDPTVDRVWRMPNGHYAMVEACDPVESDELAISVLGQRLSDFVLPAYFSRDPGPYDYGGHLRGPCPYLSPGGYQSIFNGTSWIQKTAMALGGPPSYRSQRYHARHRVPLFTPSEEAPYSTPT